MAVLIGTLGIGTQQAFADFATPWPVAECGPTPIIGNLQHGPLTVNVVGNTVAGGTGLATVIGGFVTFVLDPGSGNPTQTTNFGQFGGGNYLFAGLSPGPHTVVACMNNDPGTNGHTEIVNFIIAGPSTVDGNYATMDNIALLLAGAQTNLTWIVSIALAGAGIAAFKIRRK